MRRWGTGVPAYRSDALKDVVDFRFMKIQYLQQMEVLPQARPFTHIITRDRFTIPN